MGPPSHPYFLSKILDRYHRTNTTTPSSVLPPPLLSPVPPSFLVNIPSINLNSKQLSMHIKVSFYGQNTL
ncbi:unnamed protein product [Lactuca virosa]|uniref:Uncharacterized protein n=1 Tax=Lactuca virosa TaxID=75947 RepID=A0AAU9PDV4_9ASTR|nr:unnamed protein product [Lactuca virosa]